MSKIGTPFLLPHFISFTSLAAPFTAILGIRASTYEQRAYTQSMTADMVSIKLRCPGHLPFLCTPSLRLSLATEDYSAHVWDRWKGDLTLPGSIPPWLKDDICWIISLLPSLFAWVTQCVLYTASLRYLEELRPCYPQWKLA